MSKNKDTGKKQNICIVTFPLEDAGVNPLSHLIEILHPYANKLYVITGNAGNKIKKRPETHIKLINHSKRKNIFIRILNFLFTELRLAFTTIHILRKVHIWVFFLGEGRLLLPTLTIKLLSQRPIILLAAGSDKNITTAAKDPLAKIYAIIEKINRTLANRIVIYSKLLINEWQLEKYIKKVVIAHEHFIDTTRFKFKKSNSERDEVIGFIGRLREEKGILNFLDAIPQITQNENKVSFLVGGDGDLYNKIVKRINTTNQNSKVEITGWISIHDLPNYLNNLKLLVIPSYTEGLPNIMLEAMACGTPILATPVGAIPDVIKDEETGFIMDNNNPECIASNVIRALHHPNLEKIADKALAKVREEYTYEKAFFTWGAILNDMTAHSV